MSKIYFATDHAGFALKDVLLSFVRSLGYDVEDCGAYEYDAADDYPDFITLCAKKVAVHQGSFGIVIGASGQGEAMAANRIPSVRAAVYYGPAPRAQTDADAAALDLIASVRRHNDANVLSLGARFISEDEAKNAVRTFLTTAFKNDERHARRLAKF